MFAYDATRGGKFAVEVPLPHEPDYLPVFSRQTIDAFAGGDLESYVLGPRIRLDEIAFVAHVDARASKVRPWHVNLLTSNALAASAATG
jgi:hypothetical protein